MFQSNAYQNAGEDGARCRKCHKFFAGYSWLYIPPHTCVRPELFDSERVKVKTHAHKWRMMFFDLQEGVIKHDCSECSASLIFSAMVCVPGSIGEAYQFKDNAELRYEVIYLRRTHSHLGIARTLVKSSRVISVRKEMDALRNVAAAIDEHQTKIRDIPKF